MMHESTKIKMAMTMAFFCYGISVDAFQVPVRSTNTVFSTHSKHNSRHQYECAYAGTATPSFMANGDDSSEQAVVDADIITDSSAKIINNNKESPSKFSSLLEETGLTDLKCIKDLPSKRTISRNDVFCNRELSLGNVRAIGFDMDYTIAQYKQPAFDKLAFDGAKEKLVKKLGYPKELLDVEYDHTVRHCMLPTLLLLLLLLLYSKYK